MLLVPTTDEGNQKQPLILGLEVEGFRTNITNGCPGTEVRIDQWVIINPKEYQLVNG